MDEPARVGGSLRELCEARAAVLGEVRRFFADRGYLEVDTPALVRSPGLDLHLDAFEIAGGVGGAPAFLGTSPEYHMKRLLAEGLARIFQIARCFRRGEIGARHNPEFTMLEWYQVGLDAGGMMDLTEELVRTVVTRVRGPEVCVDGAPVDLARPFARLGVTEAFERYAGVTPDDTLRLAAQDEDTYFLLLVERVEPALRAAGEAVFLYGYPASQASLARLSPTDPRVCERFELYAGDLELCNGFGELVDPVEQRARLEHDRERRRERGLPLYPVDERFLDALERGVPPCSGNALGLDRLVALCRGGADLEQAIPFPLSRL